MSEEQAELPLQEREITRAEAIEIGRRNGFFGDKTSENKPPDKTDTVRVDDAGKSDGSGGTGSGERDDGTRAGQSAPGGKDVPDAPEPFSGFNALSPEHQAEFRRAIGERDQYKSQYASMLGKVPALQRELESFRRQASQAPTPQRTQALEAKLEKFEAYKQRFPEDAEAVDEALAAIRAELSRSTQPLAETVAQLRDKVDGYERERLAKETARELGQLTDEHPAWKQIAGWEDEQGNPVPQERQQWHPWFKAWMANLPPEIQADYGEKLKQRSAVLIGHVLNHFERDVQSHLETSGQRQPDAQEGSVAQRRSEALRDVSPRPSRSGSDVSPNPLNGNTNPNASSRAAIIARYYPQWRAGKV